MHLWRLNSDSKAERSSIELLHTNFRRVIRHMEDYVYHVPRDGGIQDVDGGRDMFFVLNPSLAWVLAGLVVLSTLSVPVL